MLKKTTNNNNNIFNINISYQGTRNLIQLHLLLFLKMLVCSNHRFLRSSLCSFGLQLEKVSKSRLQIQTGRNLIKSMTELLSTVYIRVNIIISGVCFSIIRSGSGR